MEFEPRIVVLDVGQSGTRIVRADGSCESTSSGFRQGESLENTVKNLLIELRAGAAERVGLSLTGLRGRVPDPSRFGEISRSITGAEIVAVADDGLAALVGAVGARAAVVLAVGTGVSVVARNGERVAHRDGNGPLLGDDGGGFWIGRAGFRAAIRALEGRDRATDLTDALSLVHGDLLSEVKTHPDKLLMRWCIDTAPTVLALAEQGDVVAVQIRVEAAKRLAATALAAWKQVKMDNCLPTLSGAGAVIQDSGLRAKLLEEMQEELPGITWMDAEGNQLDGMRQLTSGEIRDMPPLLRWWKA